MKQPKISIIVPIYKAEDSIRRLLDSFEKQSCQDVEFFLIDNGSPDKCGEICQEYVNRDSRFILSTLKDNIGYIKARKYGIENCNGTYVGFADSDDYVPNNCYKEVLECINNENPDLILCSYFTVNGESVVENHCAVNEGVYRGDEIEKDIMPSIYGLNDNIRFLNGFMWENFYKKDICQLNSINFIEELKPYEDQVFNIDFAKECNCIAVVDIPVYYYVFNENSITVKNLMNFDCDSEYNRLINLHNEKIKRDCDNKYSEFIANLFLVFIYSGLLHAGKNCDEFGKKIEKQYIDYIIEHSSITNIKYRIVKQCIIKNNYLLFKLYSVLLKLYQKLRKVINS